MIQDAFTNDPNLAKDKREGQYDKPGEEYNDNAATATTATVLTATQEKWRASQLANDVTNAMVENTSWTADLFLVGVPKKDPSNDLYASKVNISSRDKSTGLSLPNEPSTSVTLDFLPNNICKASNSDFTSGEQNGEWKLSDDGKILRFSINVMGYSRTVQTKGSIQKVYWSEEDEVTSETSSEYTIPPGWIYGDIPVTTSRKVVGTFDVVENGVLRIEQKMGLMGVASKMAPCGAFALRKTTT